MPTEQLPAVRRTERWRIGLFATAITLVTVAGVGLVVLSPGLPLFNKYSQDTAHNSPQCQACITRITNMHSTEHDAAASEQDGCRQIEQNCAGRCGTADPKRCQHNCKLDEYKCLHDALDRHHVDLIHDHHECHQPCHGLSNECQQCLDDVHTMREQSHAAYEGHVANCDGKLGSCFVGCSKNDKRCRIDCEGADKECRSAAQADRTHLGIRAMVDDHHKCKAVCEMSQSGMSVGYTSPLYSHQYNR
ncbi:hypothetical protein T492DRAFT_983483 [Pavlovales sp. CCMP2436]|nr:hypothetical protein T492DRAFT_983483 [Pavlovales sp. CCMP2436]